MNVYEVGRLAKILAQNDYPGSGIVLGMTPNGKKSVAIYFIMGRTPDSRSRFFSATTNGIQIQTRNPDLMAGTSHILYDPVLETDMGLVITNGKQTGTIRDFLCRGEPWEAALRTCCFECDGPNWTPRISGLLSKDGSYKLAILKATDAYGTGCVRSFYEYPAIKGLGHFIHTYASYGTPVIPAFVGEPKRVSIGNDIDIFADILWDQLNNNNKISMFVRYTNLATGEYEQRIFNKNE